MPRPLPLVILLRNFWTVFRFLLTFNFDASPPIYDNINVASLSSDIGKSDSSEMLIFCSLNYSSKCSSTSVNFPTNYQYVKFYIIFLHYNRSTHYQFLFVFHYIFIQQKLKAQKFPVIITMQCNAMKAVNDNQISY